MTTLHVSSLSRAKRCKRDYDAVITLEDPGAKSAEKLRFHQKPAPAHLVQAFEDVDDASTGVRVATLSQVESVLQFARNFVEQKLLVHCFHGVGRSAAALYAIKADRLGPGHEAEALQFLLEQQPEATPNRVFVQLADAVLARQGALVAVLDAWESRDLAVQARRARRLEFLKLNMDRYAKA